MSKTPTRSRRKTKSTRAPRAKTLVFDPAFRARTFADAENGDAIAMRYYLREAALIIEAGMPFPTRTRAFFAKALRDIADGGDANKAFRLKVGHRKRTHRIERTSLAYAVWELTQQNVTVEEACARVARSRHKSFEVVRDAYYGHK
jgi:hypothetical protein